MATTKVPAIADRTLRRRLRAAREAVDMKQQDVAKVLDWSLSKIIRIENGHVSLSTSDLVALLACYQLINTEEGEALQELARTSRQPTIGRRYVGAVGRKMANWLDHEAYAAVVRHFETKLIPGSLQTEAYAGSIVSAYRPEASDDQISKIVEARLERQKALSRADGPTMYFIIDEFALRRAVGNEDGPLDYRVMIEQLRHLQQLNTGGRVAAGETIEPSLNPNIHIQIVPLEIGAYPMMRGPFEILEFADDDDESIVFLENPDDDIVIRDTEKETTPYLDAFDELQAKVASSDRTNRHLDMIIAFMVERRNGIPATALKSDST